MSAKQQVTSEGVLSCSTRPTTAPPALRCAWQLKPSSHFREARINSVLSFPRYAAASCFTAAQPSNGPLIRLLNRVTFCKLNGIKAATVVTNVVTRG